MPFDSLSEALASPAETSDKIAFAAGYVSTWLVAVAIVWGVPYYGYKMMSAKRKAAKVSESVSSLLESRISITTEDEEAFDFGISWLPDDFQTLLNGKRREHLELWREYGIGGCVEKQAHFTQIVLSADVMVLWDPDLTLERLKPFYWLVWMSGNAVLEFRVPDVLLFWDVEWEERTESDHEAPLSPISTEDDNKVLAAYGLEDFWKPMKP